MREKEPMSMEEYAGRITEKLEEKYELVGDPNNHLIWCIIFDAIQLFQDLQDEKYRNLKEEHDEERLEKKRQEG